MSQSSPPTTRAKRIQRQRTLPKTSNECRNDTRGPSSSPTRSSTRLAHYYFFQSPYLQKEMQHCMKARQQRLEVEGNMSTLQRLKRGDMDCSFLIDERQRPAIAQTNDRILNANGANSPFMNTNSSSTNSSTSNTTTAAASSSPLLTSPTHPIFLYWTDGAKRSLPFALFKSVALKRGAARAGAKASDGGWNTPDCIFSIFGGSSALNSRLLDDKCRMQELLRTKPYVPFTRSFDITKEGWKEILRECFSQAGDSIDHDHQCQPACHTDYLILKPSLGLKQFGILILPHCLLHLPTALKHVVGLVRPGGLKGIFETWVIQAYVKEPLTLSGLDLGCIYEQGEEMKKDGGTRWKQLLTTVPGTEPPEKVTATSLTKVKPTITNNKSPPPAEASLMTTATSTTPAAATSAPTVRPITIRHTLTPSFPFLPSDSSKPVHMLGLHKCHFRVYAMVKYDSIRQVYEIYWCNLSKVYHSTEPIAKLCLQSHQESATATSVNQEEDSKQNSSNSSTASSTSYPEFDTAAKYFCAQGTTLASSTSLDVTPTTTAPLFPPLSSLPASVVTLSESFHSPSLSFDISVSKYLSMRLAHHIFPQDALKVMFTGMSEIIVDTIRETIEQGGLQPCGGFTHPASPTSSDSDSSSSPSSQAVPGMSKTYFQFLGYDFLWDTVANKPVLLEVNNNVGQGLMSQEVMSRQLHVDSGIYYGHSNPQYSLMRDYWRDWYRQPFVDGVMKLTVDRFYEPVTLPFGAKEPIRFMSTPPRSDENCWVLGDVYQRGKGSTAARGDCVPPSRQILIQQIVEPSHPIPSHAFVPLLAQFV